MFRTHKYRLYPTKTQAILIDKHIGACRFVYNLALECKKMAYAGSKVNLTCFALMKQLPELKKECGWLSEISSQALQQSIVNLDKAFTSFYKGQTEFPKFKKKSSKKSFRIPQSVEIKNNKIYFPKFREGVKFVQDREFIGQIKNSTIKKTPTGKYLVFVLVDTGTELPLKKPIVEQKAIGIDLGLSHYIITSDGLKTDNPKYLIKSIDRLKILQRRASKKVKGSENRKKANHKVALLHEKIANQRKDFLDKLSTQLINNHDTLCLEDLNIRGMIKNHSLAQSISDAGWASFVAMLKYKAEWYGKNILQIPTFEPSTKLCSSCGATNHNLTLKDREWLCKCGALHDRDINAAKNIKNYCMNTNNKTGKGIPGEPVEMRTIVRSMKQEQHI